MRMLVTEEAQRRILEEAQEAHNIYITMAHDNGDPFWIVEGWDDVHKLCAYAAQHIGTDDIEEGYTLEEAQEEANKEHRDLDWLLGEWSFSDSYTTCSNCNAAIHMHDPYPMFYLDQITGEYLCFECIRSDPEFQEEYLYYCANSWTHGDISEEIAYRQFADPYLHGWTPIGWDKEIECFPDDSPHDDYPMALNYADEEEIARLYKALRSIDPYVLLLVQYGRYGRSRVYWAKFDNMSTSDNDDYLGDPLVLRYAMARAFAKYSQMTTVSIVRSAARR